MLIQLTDCILALLDLRLVNQRLFHIGAEQSGTHRRLRLVKHPQERSAFLLLAQRFHKLQIPSGRAVDDHVFSGGIRMNHGNVVEIVLLCLVQIL